MFPHKVTAKPPKRVRVHLKQGHDDRYPPQRLDHEGHVADVQSLARQCNAKRKGGKAS